MSDAATDTIPRDALGRFGEGNKAAKGNPVTRRHHELKRAMMEAVTPEMLLGVMRSMVKAALQGDVQAARLVCEYTVGKPKERVELTGELTLVAAVRRRLQAAIVPQIAPQPDRLLEQ